GPSRGARKPGGESPAAGGGHGRRVPGRHARNPRTIATRSWLFIVAAGFSLRLLTRQTVPGAGPAESDRHLPAFETTGTECPRRRRTAGRAGGRARLLPARPASATGRPAGAECTTLPGLGSRVCRPPFAPQCCRASSCVPAHREVPSERCRRPAG